MSDTAPPPYRYRRPRTTHLVPIVGTELRIGDRLWGGPGVVIFAVESIEPAKGSVGIMVARGEGRYTDWPEGQTVPAIVHVYDPSGWLVIER